MFFDNYLHGGKTMWRVSKHFRVKRILLIIIIAAVIAASPYPFLYNASYGSGFNNSFYNTLTFENKKVMVIVPHEDDELSVAGAFIRDLTYNNLNSNIYVVFTTNGDYFNLGETRLEEAVRADASIGVKADNIIFLGYGDEWDTPFKHIYNAPPDEIVKSHNGKTETYGMQGHIDFRTSISGEPNTYTRNNYKRDLRDVILKYMPDVFIAVDFDSHPDHRATSLMFEEVMADILKNNDAYNPTVYKGFSYSTGWKAVNDFYSNNLESTLIPEKTVLNDPNYELDIPNYNWENRVRFLVPPDMLSYTVRSNLMNTALLMHKSQNTKLIPFRVINSDIVFWERRTDSLTYNADINVSSGNPNYINDFKLVDCSDVTGEPAIFDNCVWEALNSDDIKQVTITFKEPESIKSVDLYDDFSLSDNILSGTLIFSDSSEINVGELKNNGAKTEIKFPLKKNITSIAFKINKYEGSTPGLCEMEVYGEEITKEPEFIKLMLDNDAQTFIYKYFCTDSEIPLTVYTYPYINEDGYTIKLIDNSKGRAQLINNVFSFKNSILPHTAKVRVELKDNPQIYDEVEFVSDNLLDNITIHGLREYEKLFEGFVELVDKVKDKIKNII